MKNNGFTLIELLAIIIILGIIATIAGVAVTKSVKNTEGKASDIQVKNIKTAAKTWASANPYILPEVGKTLTISLNTLIAGGYIGNNGGDISNPSNDKYYSRSKTMIEITNNNGGYEYVVKASYEDNPSSDASNQLPTLIMYGSSETTIHLENGYKEISIVARNSKGEDITDTVQIKKYNSSNNVVSNITSIGTYRVVYTATDPDTNKEASIERLVKVV